MVVGEGIGWQGKGAATKGHPKVVDVDLNPFVEYAGLRAP